MKALLHVFILGLFGIEVCSPFMIGYLNNKEKKIKTNNEYISKLKNTEKTYNGAVVKKEDTNRKILDYSKNSSSDSKALKIKE